MGIKQIAKQLGLTEAGLDCLARAVARDGRASGEGFARGQGARARLQRQGLLALDCVPGAYTDRWDWTITDKGRAIVAEARRLGY